MAQIDAVLQQMAELTNTVKASGSKSNLQWDDLQKAFGAQLDALVAAQVKAQMDAAPAFRGGVPVAHDGAVKSGRYARFVKSFEQGQQHVAAGQSYRPVDLLIAKTLLDGQLAYYSPAMGGLKAQPASDDLALAVKALTSTGSGTGDELVPTNMAAQLWDDFFLASRVVNLMQRVTMPTNPFDIPLGLGSVVWRKGTENTATTASDPATAKSTLTATELVTEQNWSYTLDEDAAIAMAPAIRARLAQSGGEIMDAFALNADATNAATGNINLDDADPDDASYYLSAGQDGLRHAWIVDNTAMTVAAGGDALADGDFTGAMAKMGKYAADPTQLVAICDVGTYLTGFLGLTNVITVDKFGMGAAVLTGQLAAYRGVPIVVSASAPKTEADGKVSTTAGNNTLGQVSIFNRNMWHVGFLRNLLIETDRDIQKRQYIMVTSLRMAVAAHGTRSTQTHSAGIANILI
jgi:HK97 family phage major capsid protein